MIGLIAAAGLADDAFDPLGHRFSASIAEAAPAADFWRFRPAQATTSTATPLIRLTPATSTPIGGGSSGTATSGAGTPDPREVGTGTPDVGATPGGTSGPGEPGSGSGRGEPGRDPTTNALGTAGVMPAGTALPGSGPKDEPGSGSPNPFATPAPADFGALSATVEALRDAPFERSVGPFGAAVEVDDPAAATLWRERGSPRDDQPWAERFASNRPGPWGWSGFYPIMLILFAVAAWRVVAGIQGGDGG